MFLFIKKNQEKKIYFSTIFSINLLFTCRFKETFDQFVQQAKIIIIIMISPILTYYASEIYKVYQKHDFKGLVDRFSCLFYIIID